MPGKSRKPAKQPAAACRCFALHTYVAGVTGEAWHVSTFVCARCGAEHFADEHAVATKARPKSRARAR